MQITKYFKKQGVYELIDFFAQTNEKKMADEFYACT